MRRLHRMFSLTTPIIFIWSRPNNDFETNKAALNIVDFLKFRQAYNMMQSQAV